MHLMLSIHGDTYRATITEAEAAALDVDALTRDAEALAALPPALRHAAATALMALHLGITRLDGKTALSASEDCGNE
jgi:hypothetical protein